MKNNYNININPPEIDPDKIDKHKDFESLLRNYSDQSPASPPQSVSSRIIRIGMLAIAAMFLLFLGVQVLMPLNSETNQSAETPFIDPPIPEVLKSFTRTSFNAAIGIIYEHETGSTVQIPPYAFVDENGNEVNGEIDFLYREYHDFVDFFLSGIPMEYDSAGVKYNFESAGMVELYAAQSNVRLNVKPGKSLDVKLISAINEERINRNYNIYHLDQSRKSWIYSGQDNLSVAESVMTGGKPNNPAQPEIEELGELNRALSEMDALIKAGLDKKLASFPSLEQPIEPRKPRSNQFVFDIEVDAAQFPELSVYENVLWQLTDASLNDGFNESHYNIDWDDAEVLEISYPIYQMTLRSGDQVSKFQVSPVLTGSDYRKAYESFLSKNQAYNRELTKRQTALDEERERIGKLQKQRRSEIKARKSELNQRIETINESGRNPSWEQAVIKKKVINQFTVTATGIWNCDQPVTAPANNSRIKLVNKEGQVYLDNSAFLADKTKNTISRFYTTESNSLSLDVSGDAMLWIVTNEGKLAVLPPKTLQQIEDGKEYTLTLDELDLEIESEMDVRRILTFDDQARLSDDVLL